MKYIQNIARLPFPTQKQIERFKEYILDVHSWYKHIPLIEGSVFTIYIEPNLDREYPSNHPKLPFGNTKEGYEKAFGHLSYQYCINQFYYQDFSSIIVNGKRINLEPTEIPDNYRVKWSFKLYPYCHWEFEEGISLFKKNIKTLEKSGTHPQRDLIINWNNLLSRRNDCWNHNLNEDERDCLASIDDQREVEIESKDFSPRIFRYIKLEKSIWKIEKKLRFIEEQKISIALKKLMLDFDKIKKTSN